MPSTEAARVRGRQRMRRGALESPSVQSVDRALSILEAVAKSGEPVALGDLTTLLAIDPSNVFRLANTLKRRGFLANPNGRKTYVLGPFIWQLSRKYDWSRMLIGICHEHVQLLADRTGETAHLAVREGRQVFFIDHQASTRQSLVVSGQTGGFLPLHSTAHGKALLADCGVPELKALYGSRRLERFTPRTIASIPQLAKACADIRAKGFAVDDAEYVEDIRCVAAPIRDREGVVIASIGISAPATRFPKERDPVFARHVIDVAAEASAALAEPAERGNALAAR
jgi:IclR family transcriptional regulator, acetate operon repressor